MSEPKIKSLADCIAEVKADMLNEAFASFAAELLKQHDALSLQVAAMSKLLDKWEREGAPTPRVID